MASYLKKVQAEKERILKAIKENKNNQAGADKYMDAVGKEYEKSGIGPKYVRDYPLTGKEKALRKKFEAAADTQTQFVMRSWTLAEDLKKIEKEEEEALRESIRNTYGLN